MKSLLSRMRESGIFLQLDDQDQLKVLAKKGAISGLLVEEIKEKKAEIIDYLKLHNSGDALSSIRRVEKKESYRLSSSQFRIWILSQFRESSIAFNIPESIPMPQDTKDDVFLQAVNMTIDRHEILRTVFKEDRDGEIRQWVLAPGELLPDIDIVDTEEEDWQQPMLEYIEKDKIRPFDLNQGPLLRCCLFKQRGCCKGFYYNIHHIISDGWSADLLKKDIMRCYDNLLKPGTHDINELPIQYKDYAEWQSGLMQSEEMEAHKRYWAEQFREDVSLIDLPGNERRPSVKTYNGSQCGFFMGKQLTKDLRKLCRKNGGTLFTGLLTALVAVLHRYTDLSDIVVGTPVSGRAYPELEDQIGCYINMIALRTGVHKDDDFEILFHNVRKTVSAAFGHDSMPFEKVLEILNVKRDISRTPLFDIMMVLQPEGAMTQDRSIDHDEVPGRIEDMGKSACKYDITFEFHEYPEDLKCVIEFNTDIYAEAFIRQLALHLLKMTEIGCLQAATPLAKAQLLSPAEVDVQTNAFNRTDQPYVLTTTVIDLFERSAIEFSGQAAIQFKKEVITYQEAQVLSDLFCHYLWQEEGVAPGDLVVVSLSRSPWQIIVMLGIFKSGAIYLPVDTAFPEERIAYIRSDSGSSLTIDDETLNTFLACKPTLTGRPAECKAKANAPAYVIYTSGSTGRPKGVTISHRSLVNFLISMQNAPGIRQGDKLLSVTTPSFDISLLELLLPLISGAQVCLCQQREVMDPLQMLEIMKDIRPAIMQATPAFWSLLLDSGWEGDKGLTILCGGEELSFSLGQRLLRCCGKLWNMYGPTETTIWSTVQPVVMEEDIKSIGRPIANTTIFILDADLQLLPLGVTGEIYIGGDGLAIGYWNKPDLTKERFLSPAFDSSIILYRTGDLGKWLPDGTVKYQGRADNQVKLRGHRVELGEIDQTLAAIKGIRQAMTIVNEATAGHKELAAYFTSEGHMDVRELRKKIAGQLPGYMIPHHFIHLERLPMTPNGKLDRQGLPPLTAEDHIEEQIVEEPVTDSERALAQVFKDVLKRRDIDLRSNFFELGGDSVKAVMVVNRLRKHGFHVSISDLLKYPTLADIAPLMSEVLPLSYLYEEESSHERDKENIFPLSKSQQTYVRGSGILYAYGSFGFPLIDFNRQLFLTAYRSLFDHFPLLRIKLVHDAGGLFQRVMNTDEAPMDIEYINCDLASGNQPLADHIREMKDLPMDLFKGETVRAAVFLKAKDAYVYITVHHIVTNWRSNQMLKDLLIRSYLGQELPPTDNNYFEFIRAEQNFLKSKEYDIQRGYWEKKFRDLLPGKYSLGDVHADGPALMAVRNYYTIEGHLYNKLRRYAAENNLLLSCLVLAIFSRWAIEEAYTGRDLFMEITVDGSTLEVPGVNRSGIGQFVNVLPFHTANPKDSSFKELALSIQEHYLQGLLYQQISMSEIDTLFSGLAGLSFHQVSNIAYNFVDFTVADDSDLSGSYAIEKSELPDVPWEKNNAREIVVKASQFTTGIVLEWEVPCPASLTDRYIREHHLILTLKRIFQENI